MKELEQLKRNLRWIRKSGEFSETTADEYNQGLIELGFVRLNKDTSMVSLTELGVSTLDFYAQQK